MMLLVPSSLTEQLDFLGFGQWSWLVNSISYPEPAILLSTILEKIYVDIWKSVQEYYVIHLKY